MSEGFLAPTVTKTSAVAEIAKSKAVQEIQAALIIAKNFPRDQFVAYQRIMESCKRPSLAKIATYSYPRGGEVVTGPSIRLAEVLAQNWGNIDSGVRELDRSDDRSIVESYCWDMETNTRETKTFEVEHYVNTKKHGMKKLVDPRDIYEHIANQGARRKRSCVLAIIPRDVVDAALQQCKQTLIEGDKKPLKDRVKEMALAFKEHHGVSVEMIQDRLGHKLDLITADEFVELFGIYNAIKDKQADKTTFFKDDELTPNKLGSEAAKAAEVSAKREAVIAFDKAIADLKAINWNEDEIKKTLKVENFNEILLKDSESIYLAIEVLRDASL